MLVLGEESSQLKGKKSGNHRRTVGKGLSSYQLFRAALDFLGKLQDSIFIALRTNYVSARHDFSTPAITKSGNRVRKVIFFNVDIY